MTCKSGSFFGDLRNQQTKVINEAHICERLQKKMST